MRCKVNAPIKYSFVLFERMEGDELTYNQIMEKNEYCIEIINSEENGRNTSEREEYSEANRKFFSASAFNLRDPEKSYISKKFSKVIECRNEVRNLQN